MDNAALVNFPPVACIEEWLELAGENMNDVPAAAAGGDGPHYERVKVLYASCTHKLLKAIVSELKLSGTLTKRLLFNRIRDSSHINVKKLGDDEFELCSVVNPGEKKEAWKVLLPEVVRPIPGINLATGAQVDFFGPTNKENAVGGTRSNFLTKEKIVRPRFERKGNKTTGRALTPRSRGSLASPRLAAAEVVMGSGGETTTTTAATTPMTPNLTTFSTTTSMVVPPVVAVD